jgi:hypothetical protein
MRRHGAGLTLTAVVALLLSGVFAGTAQARPTVQAGLYRSGGKQRLIVTIANARPFTTRERPRSVAVRYARANYRLRNATPRSSAGTKTMTWQSDARATVDQLAGKRVVVTVRSAARTATFRATVAPPAVIFDTPPSTIRGEEAFRRIKQYFVNSSFTDCPAGWPNCNTEHRYGHCAGGDLNGTWQYREFPTTITDARGPYHIRDAYQSSSGSWGVTYDVTAPSGATTTYVWSVAPNGRVVGVWVRGEDSGQLFGYSWQQPAGC